MTSRSEYVLRCIGYAVPKLCDHAGHYLETFTPWEEVKGSFTRDPAKALKFSSREKALNLWRISIGTRPDGQPDRPLTAFTMEIVKLEDAK